MGVPDKERWRLVSPHLDRGLELAGDQRAVWLASLRAEDAVLAADVEALLDEHDVLDQEGFLAGESPPRPTEASLAGQTIGAYTLRSQIGQGGMGNVWLAERSDGRFEGMAAVKLLNASLVGRDGEGRFKREGSILARLRHPHIAHLIDAGLSASGQPYLILERVDGERIDHYCDARRLGIDERTRLFLDVLAAVAHAHANLIVHRDIKPSNVLVGTDGQVKLLDFGIAKLLESEGVRDVTALTREGETALTPEYAAPEQLTGGDVTTATDVYALGVLLYLILAGRHPAEARAGSTADLIRAIVETEARRLSDAVATASPQIAETPADTAAKRSTTPGRLRGVLRGDLDNIVAKALKKSASERYLSVEALADDLRRHLSHEPVSARADSVAYRTAKFVRRNRTAVAFAALAGVALSAGLAGTVSQARRARAQAARADQEARAASEQRDFALRQLSRAEAINDLNAFLLRDAAPLGKPFAVGDLLKRAERIVERQPEDSNRVEMLVEIGRQYGLQDEESKSRQVLTRAYELSRKSSEPATRAKAACALASQIALAGEGPRAEQLFQEAEREIPKEPQFALHRVFCQLSGSDVALGLGDTRAGIERAQAAKRLLMESRFASASLDMQVAMRLANSYRLAGRYPEADASFRGAFEQLTSLGRDRTESAGDLLNDWALTLRGMGQILEAERLFRRAIEISSADGTDASVSPMLLNNLARTLRELERLPEAADYAERAYAKARQTGQEVVINQALFVRAALYRQRGDLQRAADALAELEPRLTRMQAAGDMQFASLVSEQSQLAQARGNIPEALSGADRAIALAEASSQQPQFLRRLLLRRSELDLQAHRALPALADAQRALGLELEAAAPGVSSSNVGLAYLALGRALQAQGKHGAAGEAFAFAVRHLEPALGAQHPATRSARQLAALPTAGQASRSNP